MADNIKNYRYNIYINGDQTANQLSALDRETVKLEKSLQKLRNEGKQNSQQFKDTEAKIIANEQKMQTLRRGIDLNTLSLKQLRDYLRTLNTQLAYENPGTKRFKELQAEIDKANGFSSIYPALTANRTYFFRIAIFLYAVLSPFPYSLCK